MMNNKGILLYLIFIHFVNHGIKEQGAIFLVKKREMLYNELLILMY